MSLMNVLIPLRRQVAPHPVYTVEHQIRLRRNPNEFTFVYGGIVLVLIVGPLIILWLALIALRLSEAQSTYGGFFDERSVILSASQQVIGWLFLVSIGLGLVLDVASVLASVNTINRERENGHWSLIRLTNLNRLTVMQAKHALAQESTVRVLVLVINLRIALVVLFGLFSVFVELPFEQQTNLELFQQALAEDRAETLFGIATLFVFLSIYIVEPIWRMQAVTAIGTAISARIANATQSLLGGLASIAFMWISQGMLIMAFLTLLFIVGRRVSVPNPIMGWVVTLSIVGLIGILIFAYYRLVAGWGLRRAVRAGFYREV